MEKIYYDDSTYIWKTKLKLSDYKEKALKEALDVIADKPRIVDSYTYIYTKVFDKTVDFLSLETQSVFEKICNIGTSLCQEIYNQENIPYNNILLSSWVNVVRGKDPVQPAFTKEGNDRYHTHTDINEKGFVGLVQFNLITQKSLILYKASQSGTRIELCQQKDYLAFGEFPYDDLNRSSKILQIKLSASTNLAGFTTLYSSTDSDLGHMVCLEKHIYFIKTLTQLKKLNYKQTEAVKLDFKTTQIETISDLGSVNQIISMDGRVLIPYRGEFFVVEGGANLTDDRLKAPTNKEEELPLEL
jgi:hypothetical protein